jgi:hypothetical protein
MTPTSFTVPEFKGWVQASGVWKVKETINAAKGQVVLRFICGFGGSALAYKTQQSLGSKSMTEEGKSRGFARVCPGFTNCDAELRVYVTPGTQLDKILVRTRDGGRTHTHGEFAGGVINPPLSQIDSSLVTHNSLRAVASSNLFLRPKAVIAAATDVILDNVANSSNIIRNLNGSCLKEVQRMCSHSRGTVGTIGIPELIEQMNSSQEEYRRIQRIDTERALHFPRIIGVTHRQTPEGPKFAVSVSTTNMLLRAYSCPTGVISVDCTFKTNACDYPVLVTATEDTRHQFYLVSMSFVHGEDHLAYELGLTHLKDEMERVVSEFINRPVFWYPRFLMGDGAAAITNGSGKVFTDRPPVRLTCFFHVKQAIHKHQNEFGLEKAEKIVLKSQVDNLRCARSPEQFRQGMQCLREFWRSSGKTRLVEYLSRRGGFFDPDSPVSKWYWIPTDDPETLSVAWISEANSGLEGLNAQIKSQVFGRYLNGFRAAIAASLDKGVRNFSMAGPETLTVNQKYTDYQLPRNISSRCPPEVTLISQGHFLCDQFQGETYVFHNHGENPHDFVNEIFDPTSNAKRIVTFIPAGTDNIDTMPSRGGPICTCFEYIRKNRCIHVAVLIHRLRGYQVTGVLGERVHGTRNLKIISNGECLTRLPRKRRDLPTPIEQPIIRGQHEESVSASVGQSASTERLGGSVGSSDRFLGADQLDGPELGVDRSQRVHQLDCRELGAEEQIERIARPPRPANPEVRMNSAESRRRSRSRRQSNPHRTAGAEVQLDFRPTTRSMTRRI